MYGKRLVYTLIASIGGPRHLPPSRRSFMNTCSCSDHRPIDDLGLRYDGKCKSGRRYISLTVGQAAFSAKVGGSGMSGDSSVFLLTARGDSKSLQTSTNTWAGVYCHCSVCAY